MRVIHSTSLPGNITRIKMDHFSSQFGDQEMADALVAAVSSGTKGIIIDLRGNPGGFLHQVMNIGQMLLKDGIIVQNVARRGDHLVTTTNLVTEKNFIVREESTDGTKTETRYRRNAPVIVPASIPVVVLINEGSASASEILAGALQANGRAIIVGTPTRGKGVGQDLVKFDKGNRNMHVTSFEFRPGGEAMDWVGIVPDVEVKMPEFADVAEDPSADAQLNQAKAEMLGVSKKTLVRHGAVSEPVVIEMATGALQRSQAQWALAISGVAGPAGGTPDKPVGTVCFAWAGPEGFAEAETCHFPGDREAVRRASVEHALRGLLVRLPPMLA